MSTEEDLIAAIEAAPDDPAGYLVYADFLQNKGDPRGKLIVLQHAGDTKRANQVIRANKTALVGALAKLESSIKLTAWNLGFVDTVRIVADDEREVEKLLDAVVDHPSCRFLRRLEIKMFGKRRNYTGVDATLVELGRPVALREIVLGEPGDHVLSPSLLAAFPHVQPGARTTWESIAKAIRARRGAPAFPTHVGFMTMKGNLALPIDGEELQRGLASEVGNKQPLGLVAKLWEDCDPDVRDAYAASLVTAWTLHGEESRHAWAYDAASLIGGERAAHALGARIAQVSHARASHAIDCLARMITTHAVLELFAASRHWAARGEYAEAAVDAHAKRHMIDRITLLANCGRRPMSPAVEARHREIDRDIVELLMTSGWSTTLASAHLFEPPRSNGLVWRAFHGGKPVLFTLGADGAVDRDGRDLDIPAGLTISLVHPADHAGDVGPEIDAWREWQRAHPPAIEQLLRTAPPTRSIPALAELVSYETNIEALRARTYRNGGLTNELHEEQKFVKPYVYRGKTFTVAVLPTWGDRRLSITPNVVPPVVAFEIARDLAAAR